MFPAEAFQRTVEKFASILVRLEIPFHITGGSISSAYGEPGLTQDIDIGVSAEMTKQHHDDLILAFREANFVFTESFVRKCVAKGGMFQLLDIHQSLKLYVYPRELTPGELHRSETAELFSGVQPNSKPKRKLRN